MNAHFLCTENNLSNFCVIISEDKKETFRFLYFKEKPATSLRHESKYMKKTCFSEKTYLYGDFCLSGNYRCIFENERK